MLITHPTIYLDATGRCSDALLVRGSEIVAVGERARALRRAQEPIVAPQGACIFPALADAHCHLWGIGMRAGALDLGGAVSPAEVYQRLREGWRAQGSQSPSGWVLGFGWDEHRWGAGAGLGREVLDALFPQTPVCLHRTDRHAIAVNAEALRRAGLHDLCESLDDGILVDQAMWPVLAAIPAADEEEDRQLFMESAGVLRRFGITSAHMALVGVNRLPMLRGMRERGELPLRVVAMLDGADVGLAEVVAQGAVADPDAWLSVGTVKFFADGALGSRGAWLREPYRDGTHGALVHPQERMRAEIPALVARGWQVAVHAIGDAAAELVLDILAGCDAAQRRAVRPRLEHCQMLTPAACRQLGALSVVASVQPIHLRSDATWAAQVLSGAQLARLFPWRDLADALGPLANLCMAAGSDFPVDDPNPWHGIATALTRRDASGEAFFPMQAMTRSEILHAYTTGAAFAAHWEERLGRLQDGFAADFIALSHDPFVATPDEIWDMKVLQMWMAGREVTLG